MAETPSMPPSPMTALAEGAAQLHELFTAYVAAGFTSAQSMQLICAMTAAMVTAAAGQQSQT